MRQRRTRKTRCGATKGQPHETSDSLERFTRNGLRGYQVFLDMQGIEVLEGDVWGHRKDLDEYFTVEDANHIGGDPRPGCQRHHNGRRGQSDSEEGQDRPRPDQLHRQDQDYRLSPDVVPDHPPFAIFWYREIISFDFAPA